MRFEAEVIAAYGRHLLVRDATGAVREARPFGRRLGIVCGDRVVCEADATHGELHAVERLPRRTSLQRATLRGEAETVVANLSLLLVVLAPRPEPDLFMVDRYVSAAASAGITATLVLNKVDLGVDAALRASLDAFGAAGCRWLECSTRKDVERGDGGRAEPGREDPGRKDVGLEALRAACQGETAVLVGQSGVGKSSLVRRLVPDAAAETGDLVRGLEGRHTTTASRLYELAGGGRLIDSPGVRDFAPALDGLEPTSLGFVDVARLAPGCRFVDCRHMREPGCAVRAAAESGVLDARRYESYRRLRRLCEELEAARGPGRRPPRA